MIALAPNLERLVGRRLDVGRHVKNLLVPLAFIQALGERQASASYSGERFAPPNEVPREIAGFALVSLVIGHRSNVTDTSYRPKVLRRFLHPSHPPEVHDHLTRITVGRLMGNVALRFPWPFLSVIGSGLGLSLNAMGAASSAADFGGLLAPAIAKRIERTSRRDSMVVALCVLASACVVSAAAWSWASLAAAWFMIGAAKVGYDTGLSVWIADRTAYERRGQVVGLSEVSWAGSMLIVVPILGAVAALTSWRLSFVLIAVMLLAVAFNLRRRMSHDDRPADLPGQSVGKLRLNVPTVALTLAIAALFAASRCVFVTFGTWLDDRHGFTAATLSFMTVALGAAELVASTSVVRFTDALGKKRSVLMGCALMIPTGLLLGTANHSTPLAVALLVLFILGFEFSIVSIFPMVPEMQPQAPAAAFGLAVGVGTVGGAFTAVLATRIYSSRGMGATGTIAALCAGLVAVLLTAFVPEPESTTA
jgi:MFS transporter, DHA1 family, inner membrane transport protein